MLVDRVHDELVVSHADENGADEFVRCWNDVVDEIIEEQKLAEVEVREDLK